MAELVSICMQVAEELPKSASPRSHEYMATSPTDTPVIITLPFTGSAGKLQRARETQLKSPQ